MGNPGDQRHYEQQRDRLEGIFQSPVLPSPYGRQKGWERIQPDNGGGDFQELTPEEVEQLELPPEWLK